MRSRFRSLFSSAASGGAGRLSASVPPRVAEVGGEGRGGAEQDEE
ncbi:hypothetical protein Z046_20275 [Pseudomonas aeruginosa VRFPA09]|nr:hypothetical protein Z046_20275 [Pseudomonas aeruginosa VRFPA09]